MARIRAHFGAREAPRAVRPSDPTGEVFNAPEFRQWAQGRGSAQAAAGTGTDAAGAFNVGEAGTAILNSIIAQRSVMRALATLQTVATGEGVPYAYQVADTSVRAGFLDDNAEAPAAEAIVYGGGTLKFATLSTDVLEVSYELLNDSAVNLETEIVDVLGGWASPVLNAAYTNGTGTTKIEGITESARLKPHKSAVAADPKFLRAAEALFSALPHAERPGFRLMADEVSLMEWVARANSSGLPSVGSVSPLRVDSAAGSWYGNPDLAALTLSDSAFTGIPDKALLGGNFGAYRIVDDGEPVIERVTSAALSKKRQVGFMLTMRTTGRLVAPDNGILYYNEQ